MMHDYTELKKQNDLLENELAILKEVYQKPQMSEEQLKRLRTIMEEAKMTEKKEKYNQKMIRWSITAAAFIGAFVILLNTSSTVAYAMGQIPVFGQLIQVVTFRNFQYESDRSIAAIELAKIKLDNEIESNQMQKKIRKSNE